MSSLAASVRSVRLPRLAAALLVGLPLLAGAARAGQITVDFSGKVSLIKNNPGAQKDVTALLAAKGVSVGTSVTASLSYESTTPGFPFSVPPFGDYQEYDHSIVGVVIKAGSWEADFSTGDLNVNFVQVGDNLKEGPVTADSWLATAGATDTDGIFSVGQATTVAQVLIELIDGHGKASKNEDLVQDLSQYQTSRSGSIAGQDGAMSIDFTTGGGGKTSDPTALARQGQLKAAATLGNTVLKGLGKLAAAPPDKDPLGLAKDALLLKASETFGTQFLAAISKAAKKGGTAPLGESGKQAATKFLMGGLQPQSDAITDGVDTSNSADRALRGALLKALAAECHSDFIAHSIDAKKPDADKLGKALAKSRAKLEAAVGKALDKAAKKGVSYVGPDAQAIADALAPVVNGFVDLTSTGVE